MGSSASPSVSRGWTTSAPTWSAGSRPRASSSAVLFAMDAVLDARYSQGSDGDATMPTMTSFPIPHAPRTSIVACLVGLAALAAGGCSGAGAQPPNAYFTSTLGSITTPGATGMCNRGEPEEAFWTIGTEDNPVSN